MTNTGCCFGCSNVRKGSWLIAAVDIVIFLFLMINTISSLSFSSPQKKHKNFFDGFGNTQYDHFNQQMEYDFGIFSKLFIIFLFLYVNFNLKKATYIHNIQSINQWLVTNFIFFIFFVLYIGFCTVKYDSSVLLPVGIPFSIIVMYQLYVVKCFYNDELKFLAVSEHNTTTAQPICHSPPYISINNQSMQAPPAYPVQAGPYVVQHTQQPISHTSYPQQIYPCQPPQQISQPNTIVPTMELHPQEYCNPPPYSPTYNAQGSPSAKQ